MKIFIKSFTALVIVLLSSVSIAYAAELTKPHTFTSGEKAVASEVNENFDVIYGFANDVLSGEVADLKGDKGDKGDTGQQGIQGIQGLKGDKGDTGPQGIPGIQGLKGDKGDTGPQGIQGIQGLKGDKGDKGDTGPQGVQGVLGNTGRSGLNSLIAISSDPAPLTCGNGGITIKVGLDDNSDGDLDPNEVDSVAYVCNGITVASRVCEGDYIVTNDEDDWQTNYPNHTKIELSQLIGCVEITGDLVIRKKSALTSLLGLENLTLVGGDLTVSRNCSRFLTSLAGLEGITTVGGDLTVSVNCYLTSLAHLEGITSVGGSLNIQANYRLATCEAEWLRDNIGIDNIGESIWIMDNTDTGTCE